MTWWETLPDDRKRDFISYLRKICQLDLHDNPRLASHKEMISNLIIPTLEQGDGWIPEDMDHVLNLAQRWDITNFQLAQIIDKLWRRMTTPLSAQAAGRIVKRSASTMRRWARQGHIHAQVSRTGHWTFTREILIDHLTYEATKQDASLAVA